MNNGAAGGRCWSTRILCSSSTFCRVSAAGGFQPSLMAAARSDAVQNCLEPYFVTSRYDDDMGILQSSVAMRKWPSAAQGFVAIPGVVGVIDSVVAGAIAGIAAIALDLDTAEALALGGLLFVVSAAGFVAFGDRQIERFRDELDPVFPSPPREG